MIYNKTFLSIVLLNVAAAHICMWAPLQRNGYSIDTPGESLCYLKEGPCGGVASADPTTSLVGGQDFTIMFQQNLNHFYIDNPGKLVAEFANNADPAETDFTQLGTPISDYNAMNEITQTNFTMKVTIPNVDCDHCVVRLRYVSQNPTENDRGMTFYQCADVSVAKSDIEVPAAPVPAPVRAPVRADVNSTDLDCCAPQQFTLDAYEMASWRNPTTKKFYFDAVNRLFRVDTNSGSGNTVKDGYFQMYSNFTSGIEYYYNVNEGTCGLYGLNYWADWCYGSINSQSYLTSVTVGNDIADVWGEENSPFTWTNTRDNCVPVSHARTDTGEASFYFNMVVGAPDLSVHTIPSACKRAQEAMTSEQLKSLQAAPKHLKAF